MTYDYFYGQQAEMFAFYRVPKVLFTEDCFWNVSTDAKLLYGILLDRMNLSARNGWLDEEGRVYIIFTIEEIKGALLIQYTPGRSLLTRTAHSILYVGKTVSKSPNILPLAVVRLAI